MTESLYEKVEVFIISIFSPRGFLVRLLKIAVFDKSDTEAI
jgi:hypothetical protein